MRAEQISKVYPGTVALDRVDFSIRAGAVNVLVGENGAGKSTLMKIIAGVEQPTAGRILLDGKPVSVRSVRDAARHGIGIVFQELNLCPNLSVAENLLLVDAPTRFGIDIDRAARRKRAASCSPASTIPSTRASWSTTSGSASSRSSRSPRRWPPRCAC